jgi:hypothetical protein
MSLKDLDLAQLIVKALAVVDAMTSDQLMHHRRLQRISFASGNVALSTGDRYEDVKARVEKIVGPCPCADCIAQKERL